MMAEESGRGSILPHGCLKTEKKEKEKEKKKKKRENTNIPFKACPNNLTSFH
jgi:hypothetical protein